MTKGKVQRYAKDPALPHCMRKLANGDYVLHSDYQSLQSDRDRLAAENEGLRKLLAQCKPAVEAWHREGEKRYCADGAVHLEVGPNHFRALCLMSDIDEAIEEAVQPSQPSVAEE